MPDQTDFNQSSAPSLEEELLQADILFARGIILKARNQWSQIAPAFRQCAEIRQRHIPNHPDMARVLYQLGTTLFEVPEEETVAFLTEAKTIFEKVESESKFELALVLVAIARDLHYKHDDKVAQKQAKLLDKMAKDLVQPDYTEVWDFQRKFDRENIERALMFLATTLGPNDIEVAHALVTLADRTHDIACSYSDAVGMEPMYSRALDIYTMALGPDDSMIADVRKRLGFTCKHLYRNEDAQVHYEEALRILLKIHGPSKETVEVLHRMKELWEEGSEPSKIIADLQVILCPVKDEVKAAAKAIGDLLARRPDDEMSNPHAIAMRARLPHAIPPRHLKKLDDKVIEQFQQDLEREISVSMDKLTYYVGIDYDPDPLLKRALDASAIDKADDRLPSKLSVWIEIGKVSIRAGDSREGAVVRQIHPDPGE